MCIAIYNNFVKFEIYKKKCIENCNNERYTFGLEVRQWLAVTK